MAHKRQTIREYIVTLLTNGNITDVGSDVYSNRDEPSWIENLPYISIYTNEEANEIYSRGATRQYKRVLQISIDILAKGNDIDDKLDTYSDEVEDLIEADRYLGSNALNTYLVSTVFEFKGEGVEAVGLCKMLYNVEYTIDV